MPEKKTSLKTALSVLQIQLALRNYLFDKRNDTVVPNVSWGMLSYEADLLGISKSGQVTEVEIKRSIADLKADFAKHHHHDDDCITYFYYCVPEKLVDKAKELILENERKTSAVPVSEKDCPALLYYSEDAVIHPTGFGKAKRFGYHRCSLDDEVTVGRLASLRYWNLVEKTVRPEDFESNSRIRKLQEELKGVKFVLQTCEEDYNFLKSFLRYRYPDIWKEYVNLDPEKPLE